LAAIYVLGERRPGQPSIEPIPAKQAMLSLLVETYANKILDREMRSREFLALGRLLEAFPVRRIHASADFPNVASLCAVIREDFSQLRISAAAQR
jgi:hypothetical protein